MRLLLSKNRNYSGKINSLHDEAVLVVAVVDELEVARLSGVRHRWAVRTPGKRRQGCTAASGPAGIPAWAPGDTLHGERSGTFVQEPGHNNT